MLGGRGWLNITAAKFSYPPPTYQWKAASLENTMCTTTTLKGSFHSVSHAQALSPTRTWTDSLTVRPPLPFLWSSFTWCAHLSGRKRWKQTTKLSNNKRATPSPRKSFKGCWQEGTFLLSGKPLCRVHSSCTIYVPASSGIRLPLSHISLASVLICFHEVSSSDEDGKWRWARW